MDYTYKEDGKTLNQRLKEHWKEYRARKDDDILYAVIAGDMARIIRTESKFLYYRLINKILKADQEKNHTEYYGELINDPECDGEAGCPQPGIYDFADCPLPPFHPECQCDVIFWSEGNLEEEDNDDTDIG